MYYAIIVAMMCVGFIGLPMLPVVIFGALAMVFAGYFFSKNRAVLNLASVVVVFAVNHYIFSGTKELKNRIPASISWLFSEAAVASVSAIVMVLSAIVGIIGPSPLPTDKDGLLKMMKDVERTMEEDDKK